VLIRGLDFSTLLSSKQSVLVEGELEGRVLQLRRASNRGQESRSLTAVLESPGPWVLGIDFPFGLPMAFLNEMPWGLEWKTYASAASSLDRLDFVERIRAFRDGKPEGEKQPRRQVDKLARGLSPLMTDGTPVARMFWAGAGHLVNSACDVLPFQRTGSDRVVIEAYPALIARRLIGGNKYKDGKGDGRSREARATLLALVERGRLRDEFGFTVSVDPALRRDCVDDESADVLDGVFCAIQAAWAYTQRASNWGIPQGHEIEGWIADPGLVRLDSGGAFVEIDQSAVSAGPPKGSFNSSRTRVQPVFGALLTSDPTGRDWIPRLLGLANRNREHGATLAANAGTLRTPEGSDDNKQPFERAFPPPAAFLEWCIGHPERLKRPRSAEKASDTVRKRRASFLQAGTAESEELKRQALALLRAGSPAKSARQWWAFEGFTSVDLCLETDSLVLFVEGKRFEQVSGAVSWVDQRNQVARNLEVAAQYAAARGCDYAVMVIGPDGVLAPSDRELRASWPHLAEGQQQTLLSHFLGTTTWRAVCEATGIDYDSLPLTAQDRSAVRVNSREPGC
jgi:hypothetical protein